MPCYTDSSSVPFLALVTGADGFVGSHLVRNLTSRGIRVRCLVLPDSPLPPPRHRGVELVTGDITRAETLDRAFEGVDLVFHLAALLGATDPDTIHRVNVDGTRNMTVAAARMSVPLQRFVFVSSTAAIGPSGRDEKLDENAEPRPVTDYGWSKLRAERVIHRSSGFPWTILRLPLVYGPNSRGGLITFFKLINRRIQLILPEAETNVAFVGDVAEGLARAAFSAAAAGRTFHLGEQRIYGLREVAGEIRRTLGKRTLKVPLPYPLLYGLALGCEAWAGLSGRTPALKRKNLEEYFRHRYWRFDTSLAHRTIGYRSRVPLRDGVRITADWYRRHGFI